MTAQDDPLLMGHEKAMELLGLIKKGEMSQEKIEFIKKNELPLLLEHIGICAACREETKKLGLIAEQKN